MLGLVFLFYFFLILSKDTIMNTFTFEQAVVARLKETPTWNLEQAKLALRTLWKVSPAVKSELSGKAVALFLKLLEENLTSAKFTFFHLPQVTLLYNEACKSTFNPTNFIEEATTMSNTTKAIQTVSIFTDGSCNVPARTGGWGVHISLDGTDKTKDLCGSVKDTTNNLMELEAMLQAIKAVDVSKSGYKYEFNTDSKYVLQIMANQDKYESSNYKKVANTEKVKELFQALSDRGIVLESTTDGSAAFKAMSSGDVAHVANGGTVVFKWVKGHSDHPGNDKADKLALDARKLLDKTGKESTDVSGSKPVQKAVVEASEPPVARVVTEAMIREAKTFEDIKHILSLSETLELGGTCGEDFTYYTAVLHNGKSVFEIVSPERVSSREGYIKDAARQLVKYLEEEGIYHKDSIDMQETADQIEEIMQQEDYNVVEDIQSTVHTMLGDMEATPVIPSKERFSSMLEDLDKDVEEPLDHGDAKDAVHDNNFDLWQTQIQESAEIKTLTEFFDIEPSDIIISRDTYESFYEDVRVEHDLKTISDALFNVADKYYRWLPSLLLEEELDALEHKDTAAKARRSINEEYQAFCDALDIKVKEMEEEAMASTFKPLTKDLIEDIIIADPFVKNFIGGGVVPMSYTKDDTMAASILDVVIPESAEYGFVVYESDARTMSNPDGDFEEVELFVKVVPEGLIYDGVLYEDIQSVIRQSEIESHYDCCGFDLELRPATQVEIDLHAVEAYNELNSNFDFTYMMSDDSRSYSRGKIQEKALAVLEAQLTPTQKDMVALYNNYVLGRNCSQFRKPVKTLEDSKESSRVYFE